MLRRAVRQVAPRAQRRAEVVSFPAPTAGLIANRALSLPESGPQGACILWNWFPTAEGAILRRGSAYYAQINDDESPVWSLFKYVVGNNRKLFAASDDGVFDITSLSSPLNYVIGVLDDFVIGVEDDFVIGQRSVDGFQAWDEGGDWHVVQFASTGGVYLIGVNGSTTGFIYDGTAFYPNVPGGVWTVSFDTETAPFTVGSTVTGGTSGATGVIMEIIEGVVPGEGALIVSGDAANFENDEVLTDADGGEALASSDAVSLAPGVTFPTGITIADMAFVWVFKNTLWFVQKDSLSAWYLPVDSIGGIAEEFPLGGEFGQGGSLLIGQSWSLASGGEGGLSDQCVFLSTEGEAVVYQGLHPSVTNSWSKVGTYRIGKPMGRRAFIRAGGDLVFATTIGFVALSTAVQVDMAALSPRAVSYAIEEVWNTAVAQRGQENWVCALWPEGQMVAVSPPKAEVDPLFLVSNARTGAWAPFSNWDATCMEVFEGRLFFGTPDGYVMEAMVGGTDRGTPYTGSYAPLFTDAQKPSTMKVARMARSELLSRTEIHENISCLFDFDFSIPPPPPAQPVGVGNEWDNALWGESVWSAARDDVVTHRRHSVSGNGYKFAPVLQITSGSTVPPDVRIVSVDVTIETGDVFT